MSLRDAVKSAIETANDVAAFAKAHNGNFGKHPASEQAGRGVDKLNTVMDSAELYHLISEDAKLMTHELGYTMLSCLADLVFDKLTDSEKAVFSVAMLFASNAIEQELDKRKADVLNALLRKLLADVN
ncbi:MAG: hypothetical protein KDA57_13980 [Planctomycetales bacterium]|nr:hypothetical protein [Planctomycetales bacterium]